MVDVGERSADLRVRCRQTGGVGAIQDVPLLAACAGSDQRDDSEGRTPLKDITTGKLLVQPLSPLVRGHGPHTSATSKLLPTTMVNTRLPSPATSGHGSSRPRRGRWRPLSRTPSKRKAKERLPNGRAVVRRARVSSRCHVRARAMGGSHSIVRRWSPSSRFLHAGSERARSPGAELRVVRGHHNLSRRRPRNGDDVH